MKTVNEFLTEFKDYYGKVGAEGRIALVEGIMSVVIDASITSIKFQNFNSFQMLSMTKEQLKIMQKLSEKLKLTIITEHKLQVKFKRLITTMQRRISEKAETEREAIKEKILMGYLEFEADIYQFVEEKLAELGVSKYKNVKQELYEALYKEYLNIWQEEKQKLQ